MVFVGGSATGLLLTDVAAAPGLRAYVADVSGRLPGDEGFLNALPGLVIEGSPADRTPVVLQRLRVIAQLAERQAFDPP